MVFRGRPLKDLGPADTKRADVTLETQSSESFRAECSVSRASTFSYKLLFSACFLLLVPGLQGDILTVIRCVDEHWIEAKLGEKVGLCPLQFVEVSSSFLPSTGQGLFVVIKFDTCHLALWSDHATV